MTEYPDHARVAFACLSIRQVLHELLQAKKISAQEFLSMVGQLPMSPLELDQSP